MVSANSNPPYVQPAIALSQQQQTLCSETLRFLNDLGPLVGKIAKCGVDCSSYEALRQRLIEVNTQIHTEFCRPQILPS